MAGANGGATNGSATGGKEITFLEAGAEAYVFTFG